MTAERIAKETISSWELHHRIFCVKNYYKCGLVEKILEHTFFEIDRELYKSVIQDWVSKFETYGIAVNLNKKFSDRFSHSGRPRTRTQQIVESPKRSLLRCSQSLNLSMSAGRKVIVT